jgi:hypothetical protein
VILPSCKCSKMKYDLGTGALHEVTWLPLRLSNTCQPRAIVGFGLLSGADRCYENCFCFVDEGSGLGRK